MRMNASVVGSARGNQKRCQRCQGVSGCGSGARIAWAGTGSVAAVGRGAPGVVIAACSS